MNSISIDDRIYDISMITDDDKLLILQYENCCERIQENNDQLSIYDKIRSDFFSDLRREILSKTSGIIF